MKENSIEEDIKLVEELINAAKEYNQFEGNKYHKAIEHILKDYKRILKENEELEEINNELEAEKNEAIRRYNFETIPIKKVKDKIDYLEDYIEENSDEQGYWGNINPDVIYGQIEILDEILKLESE